MPTPSAGVSTPKEKCSNDTLTSTKTVTLTHSIITGSLAGAAEVAVDHPLWVIKTRLQCKQAFTLDPRVLYRGIIPNALSMTPITAMQVGLNHVFSRVLLTEDANKAHAFACAFMAGGASAVASCPTEYVMTAQQNTKQSFFTTTKLIAKQHGIRRLFSGLMATGVRDGIFSAAFQTLTPWVKTTIKPYYNNDVVASVVAGTSSGVVATLLSQAFDTIKTKQQQDVTQPQSFVKASRQITSEGYGQFFKGGLPRGMRVCSAVTIMGWTTEKLLTYFNSPTEATAQRSMKPTR